MYMALPTSCFPFPPLHSCQSRLSGCTRSDGIWHLIAGTSPHPIHHVSTIFNLTSSRLLRFGVPATPSQARSGFTAGERHLHSWMRRECWRPFLLPCEGRASAGAHNNFPPALQCNCCRSRPAFLCSSWRLLFLSSLSPIPTSARQCQRHRLTLNTTTPKSLRSCIGHLL
jgi:hypothetical protein